MPTISSMACSIVSGRSRSKAIAKALFSGQLLPNLQLMIEHGLRRFRGIVPLPPCCRILSRQSARVRLEIENHERNPQRLCQLLELVAVRLLQKRCIDDYRKSAGNNA